MSRCKSVLARSAGLLFTVFFLAGCSGLGQVPAALQRLDLGAPPQSMNPSSQVRPTATLVIPPVSAPTMLQGVGVIWRMGPEGLPNRYATYEWTASPDSLIHERLVDRLSQDFAILSESVNSDDLTLRLNLLQFEQVYAADGSSNQGIVGVQAVLLRRGEVLGQYRETERVTATSNDAPAGARALRIATNQMADNIATWIVQVLQK